MATQTLLPRRIVKRVRRKHAPTTEIGRRLEKSGMSMYELARRTTYSYQHIWEAVHGKTTGSEEFWAAVYKHVQEYEREQATAKVTPKTRGSRRKSS